MMDRLLQRWMARTIDDARRRPLRARRAPGERLKLLLVGYNGTRNTGSDVRVEEMLRQLRQLFGADRVDLRVFSYVPSNTRGYFGDARQVKPDVLFPAFLRKVVPTADGVIACEGSTFKSTFTDLLSVMMVGAMGLASAHGRLSIAYGAEAGPMNPSLRWMVREYCRQSYVITRNERSRGILAELGVASEAGTDTTWTFEPHPPQYGREALRRAGWRGEPVLVICPINPFWWPVKASLVKSVARLAGGYRDSHYARIFFFNSGPEVERAFERYLAAIVAAVGRLRQRHTVFAIVAASERLDEGAMRRVADRLGGVPTFSSGDYDMHQLVSIMRCGRIMLSSRFHAMVTTMPARVASAGVTMDERIANLMEQRGHTRLLARVDDADLADRLDGILEALYRDADRIADESTRTVVHNLKMMADMGRRLQAHVVERHPDLAPVCPADSWDAYLPPVGPGLRALLETASL